jgi:hypothetical protein
MNQDSRTLLSLVATGRMTSAEAERWLVASREEREERNEWRWVLLALTATALTQFCPALTAALQWAAVHLPQLQHALSALTGQF